jgi:hypothetical protein
MSCCKIGCGQEAVRKQRIAFVNEQGYIIHCYVLWCKHHEPKDIMLDDEIPIVHDRGAAY